MSLAESRGQITKAYRDLQTRWERAHGEWNDGQAEQFEKQYLLHFEAQVRKTLSALDHMNIVLLKTVKDCE